MEILQKLVGLNVTEEKNTTYWLITSDQKEHGPYNSRIAAIKAWKDYNNVGRALGLKLATDVVLNGDNQVTIVRYIFKKSQERNNKLFSAQNMYVPIMTAPYGSKFITDEEFEEMINSIS